MQIALTETDQDTLHEANAADDAAYQTERQQHKKIIVRTAIVFGVLVAVINLILVITIPNVVIVMLLVGTVAAAMVVSSTMFAIFAESAPARNSRFLHEAKRKVVEDRLEFTFTGNETVNDTLSRFLVKKDDEIVEVMLAFTDTHIEVLPVKAYTEPVGNL